MRQAFTENNLRKIYDYENRKGVNLEGMFFPELQSETETLKKIATSFRQLKAIRGVLPPEKYKEARADLDQQKLKSKEKKEKQLSLALSKISNEILRGSFNLTLNRLPLPSGRVAYGPNKTCAVSYFAIKQVQKNIRSIYKVKQENRSQIISQLTTLLGDQFPKWVLRLDVKSFFESIPHKVLLEKLSKDAMLSFTSQRIIQRILSEYRRVSQSSVGVPRGVGISAYLSELYMRKFDRSVIRLDNIIYYARYVDDVIAIFSPDSLKKIEDVFDLLKDILDNIQLSLNMEKVSLHDISTPKNENFEYLGYRIFFGNGNVKIQMSSRKFNRYKERINLSICEFDRHYATDYNRASKLLYSRLKFLSGNTRLYNSKKHILTGIFFSNEHLTDYSDLKALDDYLRDLISLNPRINSKLRAKIQTLSFEKGYVDKAFYLFSTKGLAKITKAWKNVS